MPFDPTITWAVIFTVLNAGFVWWRTRDEKLAARFRDVRERMKTGADRMNRHELRLNGLEQTVRSMPGKEDVHALQLELARQTGALAEMSAHLAGSAKIMERLELIVSRHEDHLLGGKGR